MEFAQRHAITDTCLLVRDLETSIAFYRDELGFALRRRACDGKLTRRRARDRQVDLQRRFGVFQATTD